MAVEMAKVGDVPQTEVLHRTTRSGAPTRQDTTICPDSDHAVACVAERRVAGQLVRVTEVPSQEVTFDLLEYALFHGFEVVPQHLVEERL